MQKKNLIYIIGGAAIIGFFLYKKKKSAASQDLTSLAPDQELAPSFVNTAPSNISVAKKVRAARPKIAVSRKRKASPAMLDEVNDFSSSAPASAMREVMQDVQDSSILSANGQGIAPVESLPLIAPLSAKAARQSARATKQEVRASGGTAKQARQAARSVRKEARQARRMGDLPLTF